MNTIEGKLTELGLLLNPAKPLMGKYMGTKKTGDLLFVSGRVSGLRGVVGEDVTEDQAKQAARDTVLDQLALIKQDIADLDQVMGVVKLHGFIRASHNFYRLPEVLDGASELLISLWGDAGWHTRTATGIYQLPFGAVLQIDMILQMCGS